MDAIEAIAARLAGTTPGPWRLVDTEHMVSGTADEAVACLHIVGPPVCEGDNIRGCYEAEPDLVAELDQNFCDADFIAHAWQDVKDLLATVRELRAVIDDTAPCYAYEWRALGTRAWCPIHSVYFMADQDECPVARARRLVNE